MTSRRKRKSNRSICSQEIIDLARKRVADGESKRSVAKELGMAESSLRLRLSRSHSVTTLGRYDTTFTKEVEAEFCEYLKKLDNMFFGMTTKDLRALAYEYAEKNKIPHRFNTDTKIAGKEWLRGFMKRHPDISLRQPTSTSIARAMGFNMPQCERFFINLTALMDKYNFSPNNMYNMDETGISSVPNNPPKVISTKGKRAVNKISSGERGTNVTVVSAMSATGHFVPPTFIFGRKRMKAELLDGAPPGSIAMVSDSSFINSNLFIQWLSHFKDHTKPTKDNPVLLILDNHSSHTTIEAVDFYRDNNIIALTLPPHSSHKLQPLDRGFHVALKRYYSNECEKWLRNHPGRTITVYQMATIFTPAFFKAATPACAAESYKTTGIWPYNPDVFSEADFLASTVTERENEPGVTAPLPECEPLAAEPEIIALDDDVISQDKDTRELPQTAVTDTLRPQELENSGSTNSEVTLDQRKLESKIEEEATCSQEVSFKISDILPLPKSQIQRSSTRRHKKSDIISSSPYKAELQQQIEERSKPKVKKLKIEPTASTSHKNIKKPTPKRPNKKFLKPKSKNIAKKIWKCPGCGEIYEEPITEDWIQCVGCTEWWHEKCTAYDGAGSFNCDFCD